ncbi:MAG: hypothetical protein A3J04_01825 [Candidatus Ryanbacteria bacterium RIFCSPLOWO2_02_FULL_47_14]|uniref:Uncharacterized protein n=2 Tax=Parcubacteria group TaxID=1794811 RepID=A0A1G2H533_9BACT|nr:MAG: hypothetical protein A3J04_01825 [Candidatus Ryanbacteria bacterium RIFCSPLOWO2_02_FULL_47_14]HCJ52168.1 hypothetical protein [Candidatus Kerfeldbacteria bacterium]
MVDVMGKLVNTRNIVAAITVVLLVAIASYSLSGDEESVYDTVGAERENLVQEISATGRVVAIEEVDLAFENSGRVARVLRIWWD